MSKKRLKTDGVDGLLEIVRAIQNGEEPDEALRRKQQAEQEEAERLEEEARQKREAAREAARLKKEAAREEARLKKEARKAAENDLDEDTDIETDIEEEEKEASDEKKAKSSKKSSRSAKASAKKSKSSSGSGRSLKPKKKKEVDLYSDEDDFEDDEFDRILDEDGDDGLNFKPIFDALGVAIGGIVGFVAAQKDKASSKKEKPKKAPKEKAKEETAKEETAEEELDLHESEEKKDAVSEEAPGFDGVEILNGDELEEETTDTSKSSRKTPKKKSQKKSSKKSKKKSHKRDLPFFGDLKNRVKSEKKTLAKKGIRSKELTMILIGGVLVVVMAVLIVNGVSVTHRENAKKANVTADEGLIVTVENQPQEWVNSYPIALGVKVPGVKVEKVIVNKNEYVPDENNVIVVVTSDTDLSVTAVTEQGNTLKAQVVIPKMDSVAPSVHVEREGETITVTAEDAASPIQKIFYAALKDNDYIRLPLYQEYTEPIQHEENTSYYFYAQDAAGNCSQPLITSTDRADRIELSAEKLSLFPGENAFLSAAAIPANSLLNDLSFESENPSVATVSATGTIMAVEQGSTVIRVSAEGLKPVSCTVEVSDQRKVTISAIGDCTLGTDAAFDKNTNFDAFDVVNGHKYFFNNVRSILEKDDVTFANLEGPLTTESTRGTDGQFAFKGDPEYTQIVQDGSIEVVTLANNHTADFGPQGLADTEKYLDEAGIDYCLNDKIVLRDTNGIKTAYIGIYELRDGIGCKDKVESTIAAAKEQGAQLIIVAFHWGSELAESPDDAQRQLAHLAIDRGADLVIGHHPHILQGIEKYEGKYIVYSLGNFCFGGNSGPRDMDTMIFRQTFTVTRENVLNDDDIAIIPCSISSAEGYNNYQPTPAQGDNADRIMAKLNERSSEFGQSFTASAE